MGFKKKVLGTIAAAALTLSMFGGVAAQQATDSVDGSVKLAEGICKVSIAQSDVSFGTWTYQGNGYTRTGGSNEVTLNGTMTAAKPGGTCNLTATTSGLTGSSGLIGANHFTGGINGAPQQNLAADDIADGSMHVPGLGAGSANVDLTLVSVPDDYKVGEYKGTLKVSVVKAN